MDPVDHGPGSSPGDRACLSVRNAATATTRSEATSLKSSSEQRVVRARRKGIHVAHAALAAYFAVLSFLAQPLLSQERQRQPLLRQLESSLKQRLKCRKCSQLGRTVPACQERHK